MAESYFILGLEFLHIQGGCSFIIVFFLLMLVGPCYYGPSPSLSSEAYIPNFRWHALFVMQVHSLLAIYFGSPFHDYTTTLTSVG